MSTRAQIVFINDKNFDEKENGNKEYFNKNSKAILYKHSDGYPEGLGASLTEFTRTRWFRERANDIEYLSAMCLVFLSKQMKWVDEIKGEWGGLGISEMINGDIDYLYVFNVADGCLYRYEIDTVWEGEELIRFLRIQAKFEYKRFI